MTKVVKMMGMSRIVEVKPDTDARRRERSVRLIFGGAMVLLAVTFLLSLSIHAKASSKADAPRIKYYTSVEIEKGDNLWSIAGDYISPEYKNMTEYIDEVRRMNHISGDTIHAGCYLIVPYYATEPRN